MATSDFEAFIQARWERNAYRAFRRFELGKFGSQLTPVQLRVQRSFFTNIVSILQNLNISSLP